MFKKAVNLSFVLLFFTFVLGSLISAVFFPVDINTYENRTAATLQMPTWNGYLAGDFQDNMESAMSDQVLFSEDMKRAYNRVQSGYMRSVVTTLSDRYPDNYIDIGGIELFAREYLVFEPSSCEIVGRAVRRRANEHNRMFKKYPDIDFYLYYIEKDVDIDFTTDEKTGIFPLISSLIDLPEERKAVFEVESFDEFTKMFYKTDHHWNADGAYKGYTDVVGLLLPDEKEFIRPGEKVQLSDSFSGSKTITEGAAGFSEPFWVYRYEYPEMKVISDDIESPDYGRQEEFFSGKLNDVHYSDFYGYDFGETVLEMQNPEKDNLLIIGESYDNAILKLVASHFNRTVAVDLRYYQPRLGREFSLDECLEKYEIDKVLLMGNIDYFTSKSFSLEK